MCWNCFQDICELCILGIVLQVISCQEQLWINAITDCWNVCRGCGSKCSFRDSFGDFWCHPCLPVWRNCFPVAGMMSEAKKKGMKGSWHNRTKNTLLWRASTLESGAKIQGPHLSCTNRSVRNECVRRFPCKGRDDQLVLILRNVCKYKHNSNLVDAQSPVIESRK